MALIVEKVFTVERPVEEVFSYISNMENFGRWFPEVIAIESCDDLSITQVGKQYLETVKIPFKGRKKIPITVVDLVQNETFVTEGKFPPVMPRMEVRFRKTNVNQCEVAWRMFSRNKSTAFRFLVLPVVTLIMSKRAEQGVAKIKSLLR